MHISDLRFATLWIYLANGLKVIMRHAAAFISKTEKLATNNQFNYPQNIYCRTGFVIQTQRRRDGARSDFLLHWVRPFSRRFVVVIARFSVCCFTPPSYLRAFTCSSCAAAPIYTYHPDPRWVCHICCFMSRLLSCLELYGLVCRRSHWPVCNTGIIWVFICSFFFFFYFRLSVCLMWSCVPQYNYLSSSRCSSAAGAPASLTLHKKDHRPGDDISEIMSIFTRTSRPLHLERKERIRSLQMPSHHLSLTVRVESRWGEPLPLHAVMNCHHHLAEDRYRL